MALKASSLAFLALIILVSVTTTTAFNITKVLEHYSDLGNFNDLLTQTELASQVNKRQTITILAVNNGAISAISGRPTEEIKNILMNHIVLDYYDEIKLKGMKDKSSLLTTMFQTTGVAEQQNGFLNCTKTGGKIMFGPAAKGSPLIAQLEKVVYQQPYNLSILQVSMPIVSPGIGAPVQAPPPPPFTPPPAPAPRKAHHGKGPAPAEEDDSATDAAPEAEPSATSPSPSKGPAPGPGPGPRKSKKPEKAADEIEAPAPSSASKLGLGFGVAVVMGLIASFVWF